MSIFMFYEAGVELASANILRNVSLALNSSFISDPRDSEVSI